MFDSLAQSLHSYAWSIAWLELLGHGERSSTEARSRRCYGDVHELVNYP
jgi:hypothetical protein